MSKIQGFSDLGTIKDPDQFMVYASRAISSIVDAINGNIDFSANNLNIQILKDVSLIANQDNTLDHSLGRVPQGYFTTKTNSASAIIEISAFAAFTDKTVTFRTGTSCTMDILLF